MCKLVHINACVVGATLQYQPLNFSSSLSDYHVTGTSAIKVPITIIYNIITYNRKLMRTL